MIRSPDRVTRELVASVRAVNATVALTVVTLLAYALPLDPLVQGARVLGPLLVFGATATVCLRGTLSLAQRIGLVLALGLGLTMLAGALEAVVLTHLGVAQPLRGRPLGATLLVLQVACVTWSVLRRLDPVGSCFSGATLRHWLWAVVLAGLSLLSLFGMERANQVGSVVPSIVAGLIVLVLVVAAVVLPEARWAPPKAMMLASAVLMAAWQVPLRGGWLLGGDLPHEYFTAALALSQGRFPLVNYTDTYGEMLSLTVWPAEWHSIAGLSLLTVFGLLPEVALACCVLIAWGTVRERVGARAAAAICALFVVAAPDLVSILPEVSRQCYAILFLSVLVFAISSVRLSTNSARVLALAAIGGIAITHYSTAFIAAAIVVGAAGLSYLLPTQRTARVLSLPVAGGTAAVVVLWDVIFAGANSNLSQVVSAISTGPKGGGGTTPPPVKYPALRCMPKSAPTASAVSVPGGAPHAGTGLLAATSSVTPPGAAGSGPAAWAVVAIAIVAAAALLYAAWRLFRTNRGGESWKRISAASLVSLVVLGAIGLIASYSGGLARLVRAPYRAFVSAPANVSIADAAKVRADDLYTLRHGYDWMRLAPGSCSTRLTSFPPSTAKGVPVLSPIAGVTEVLASKGLILVAVASVIICLIAAIKDRRLVGLAGMGVAAVAAASAWKFIPAMAQFFGTDRIQIETYFVFAATTAAAIQWLQSQRRARGARPDTVPSGASRPNARLGRSTAWIAVGLVAAVVMAGSMGLINLVTPGRPLDAAFSAHGQQIELAATPAELPAAQWLASARATGLVQADFTSLGALGSISDGFDLVMSVDPVITDVHAWVFVSQTNLVQGRAYGGSTTYKAAFHFPLAFFRSSRPTLFASNGAIVLGSVRPPHS